MPTAVIVPMTVAQAAETSPMTSVLTVAFISRSLLNSLPYSANVNLPNPSVPPISRDDENEYTTMSASGR